MISKNTKKQIAIVIKSMDIGGVEKQLIELLNIINYQKFDVTVFVENSEGILLSQIPNYVKVKCWEKGKNNSKQNLIKQLKALQLGLVFKGCYNRLLARINSDEWGLGMWYSIKCQPYLDDSVYDCAIAYHDGQIDVIANVLYRLYAKKKILWVHSKTEWTEKVLQHNNCEYTKFHKIICVSDSVKKDYMQKYTYSAKKAEVIHNVVDYEKVWNMATRPLMESIERPSLLTIGRLSEEKGQDMIPKTVRILQDNGFNITWYLIGEGKLRDKIEEQIKEYNVGDSIVLLGMKDNPYPYIKACDIYIQTSLTEGWGLTVQEAKIMCKPIVITPEDALKEQIQDGVNGLVAKEKTSEALAECVKKMLIDRELRNRLVSHLSKNDNNNMSEVQKFFAFIEQ